MERCRSHFKGAPVWCNRTRGKSWRGRQGALLVPRLYPNALVYEVSYSAREQRVYINTLPRRFLYKYPQREFPYERLVQESLNRGRDVSEFEILDTDAFDEDRYWDIFVEVCIINTSPDMFSSCFKLVCQGC